MLFMINDSKIGSDINSSDIRIHSLYWFVIWWLAPATCSAIPLLCLHGRTFTLSIDCIALDWITITFFRHQMLDEQRELLRVADVTLLNISFSFSRGHRTLKEKKTCSMATHSIPYYSDWQVQVHWTSIRRSFLIIIFNV